MRPSKLLRTPLWRQCRPHHVHTASTRSFHTTKPLFNSASSKEEIASARNYCAQLVRKYDAASFTLMAFIPPHAQDAYLAIRALNIDVAQILDTTSVPAVGAMRMEFWRKAVTRALEGHPPQEPVATLLGHAAQSLQQQSSGSAKLSKNWLLRLINTREQSLGNPPYPTLSALETYAENTYSTMLYLTLSALPQASITTDHIASHIGKAMGIVAILRGVPFIAFPQPQPSSTNMMTGSDRPQQGAIMLPLDVMAEANVKEEDIFRQGGSAPGLRDAVFTVATRANDHLITAREMISKLRTEGEVGHEFEHQNEEEHRYLPQQFSTGKEAKLAEVEQAFGVFMPGVATQSWLDRLQKVDFDVFDPQLRRPDWKLAFRAWWAYRRRQL